MNGCMRNSGISVVDSPCFSDDTFLEILAAVGRLDDYIDLMDELESNKKKWKK